MAALPLTALLLTACSPATPVGQESTRTPRASQESTPTPSPARGRGIASISFDDGTIDHYTNARPALRKYKVPGTYYLISDALGWGSARINAKQARKLADEGNEIGNHTRTHPDLAKLTPAQVTAQFADAQDALESQVGVRPTTCAYPEGSSNPAVRAAAKKLFKGCRSTTARGFNEPGTFFTPYELSSFYVLRGTTAAEVREAAEVAHANDAWVVFVYHRVDAKKRGPDDITPELFAAHVEAIVSTGIQVQTVESALAVMSK